MFLLLHTYELQWTVVYVFEGIKLLASHSNRHIVTNDKAEQQDSNSVRPCMCCSSVRYFQTQHGLHLCWPVPSEPVEDHSFVHDIHVLQASERRRWYAFACCAHDDVCSLLPFFESIVCVLYVHMQWKFQYKNVYELIIIIHVYVNVIALLSLCFAELNKWCYARNYVGLVLLSKLKTLARARFISSLFKLRHACIFV